MSTTTTDHDVEAIPIEKLRDGVIGYRWRCSCGRERDGIHPTPEKAVLAGRAHFDPDAVPRKRPKRRWSEREDQFREAMKPLVGLDLTEEQVHKIVWNSYLMIRSDDYRVRIVLDEMFVAGAQEATS
jgi:hypothetical protein